eukprot:TRINITY_DN2874_c0_g1_i1.p1 TRINITY_DN2874_c0_g1~~TRINITY_DN2874_c0_g1_i1.p1  ORF type:complete len:251 (+),score=54.24 TRINITY_DN2874_c0_g1_i1:65-817(+)
MSSSLADGVALKPYLTQITKLSSESAVANTIPQILSDPNVYVFGELLALEKIQALNNGEYKKVFDLLEIFAYGRFSDFKTREEDLPKLTAKQAFKLRQLTVVSLATESRVIPYSKLLQELDMSSPREVEELIIDGLYKGILKGKLDSGGGKFNVETTIGRDVRQNEIDELLTKLGLWEIETRRVLESIEKKIKYAQEEHDRVTKAKETHIRRFEESKASVKTILESEIEGHGHGGMMGIMNAMTPGPWEW